MTTVTLSLLFPRRDNARQAARDLLACPAVTPLHVELTATAPGGRLLLALEDDGFWISLAKLFMPRTPAARPPRHHGYRLTAEVPLQEASDAIAVLDGTGVPLAPPRNAVWARYAPPALMAGQAR